MMTAFYITIWIISFAYLIFKFLKYLKRTKVRKQSHPVWIEGVRGQRVKEGGELYAEIATNICPDCGHIGFFEGPSGGLSANVFCANWKCKSGFNITPYIGTAERIGKCTWHYDDEEDR